MNVEHTFIRLLGEFSLRLRALATAVEDQGMALCTRGTGSGMLEGSPCHLRSDTEL